MKGKKNDLGEKFNYEWYDEINQTYVNLDRNLLDKVTHAFYLLEKLSNKLDSIKSLEIT